MLRILLGYRGHSTEESPAVLYAGHDGDAAQAAADTAPAEFVRLRRIDGAVERNAKRDPNSTAAQAARAEAEKAKAEAEAEKAKAEAEEAKAKAEAEEAKAKAEAEEAKAKAETNVPNASPEVSAPAGDGFPAGAAPTAQAAESKAQATPRGRRQKDSADLSGEE